jgi:hypothetical protein
MLRRFFRSQDGGTAVYFALLAPVLIGFAGLASEAGLWLVTERKLQHISDLAAYSGATRAQSTTAEALITSSAQDRATSSGLRPADTIVINTPPASGPNAGRTGFVEVITQRSVARYLTTVLTNDATPLVITTRAVAGAIEGSGEPVCMLALSPTASPAFSVGGSATVNVLNCAFAANSTAQNSFDMIGAKVTVSGSCLYTVGGVSVTEGLTLTDCTEPQVLQRPNPDPYADLPMLASTDVGGLARRGKKSISNAFTPSEYLIDYPGMPVALFDGGLTLQGDITLGTGLYIVDGGTLKINANTVLSGTGVSFYLMNGAKLDVAGGAELDLQAFDAANPDTRPDPFAGILFFGDRTGTSVSHSLSGNSASDIDGVIYFPNDTLTYTGNSGSSYPCIQVIASQLKVSGNGTVTIGCNPSVPPGSPVLESALRVKLLE